MGFASGQPGCEAYLNLSLSHKCEASYINLARLRCFFVCSFSFWWRGRAEGHFRLEHYMRELIWRSLMSNIFCYRLTNWEKDVSAKKALSVEAR